MPRPPTSVGSKSGSTAPISSVIVSGSSAHETLLSTINIIASSVNSAHSIGPAIPDISKIPSVSFTQANEPSQVTASAASAGSASSSGSVSFVTPVNFTGSAGTTSSTDLASDLVSKTASSHSMPRPSDITKPSVGTLSFATSYSGSSPTEPTPATYTGAANNNNAKSACVGGSFM